jgi:hypothetical protein
MRPALLPLILAAPALAQQVPIADPGFENLAQSACGFSAAFAPAGWVIESGGAAGTWRPGTCWDITPFEGLQVGFSNGSPVAQHLTTNAMPGASYTLSFAVGARNHSCCTFSSATVQLLVNTTGIGALTISGSSAPAPGTWRRYSITASAPTSLPANPYLAIRFSSPGSQADFDSFFLEFTPSCGTADFNNDGDSGTDADIEAFFACLAGNCCATCQSADFNFDGDTGTDADIEAFFRVLAGGSC